MPADCLSRLDRARTFRFLAFMSAAVAVLSLVLPATARAGGVTLFEFGLEDNGRATAGRFARADDASTSAFNPAGMTRLEGTQYVVASTPLYTSLEWSVGSDTMVPGGGGDGGDAGAVAPTASFFLARPLSDRTWFGFGFYGAAGLSADYDDDWAGRYYLTEESLEVLLVEPTIGFKVSDRVSIGGGAIIGYATLEVEAAVNNSFGATAGDPDGKLKVDDGEVSYGGNASILIEASDRTRFGVSYFSQMDYDFSDALSTSGITNPALMTLFATLGELDLEIHMPQHAFFSWYTEVTDSFALTGNLGWEEYEEFGYVEVNVSDPNIPDVTVDLQFQNIWHVALGGIFKTSDTMTWTTGISYDESPVSSANRSIAFPLGQQVRISGGFQRTRASGNQWGVNLTYMDGGDASSDQMGSVLKGRLQGEFDTYSLVSAGFNWTWR